jgi:hypothetical protein
MPVNAQWHEQHPMPRNATFEQRAEWHLAHREACACRPIPAKLREQMVERGLLPRSP